MSVSGIPGIIGWAGYAKEITFGTPINPVTGFVPILSNGIQRKRAPIIPTLMSGTRDAVTQYRQGQQIVEGALSFPLFPDAGMALVAGAFGPETETTGSSGANNTTLSAASIVGATTITVTSPTGYTVGEYVQVGAGGTGAEVRKILTVSTDTLTLDVALNRAHANAAVVTTVVAPFTQTRGFSLGLDSYTVEVLLQSNTTSLQYNGCLMDKLKIAADNKGEIKADVTVMGLDEAPLTGSSISTYAGPTSSILAFPDVTIGVGTVGTAIGGSFTSDANFESFDWDVDQGTKARYGYSGNLYPTNLIPDEIKQTFKTTRYYNGLTFRTDFDADTAIAVRYQALNASGYGMRLSFPELHFKDWLSQKKVGSYLDETLDFEVKYNATLGASAQMQIISASYLPL